MAAPNHSRTGQVYQQVGFTYERAAVLGTAEQAWCDDSDQLNETE